MSENHGCSIPPMIICLSSIQVSLELSYDAGSIPGRCQRDGGRAIRFAPAFRVFLRGIPIEIFFILEVLLRLLESKRFDLWQVNESFVIGNGLKLRSTNQP